MPVPDPYEVQQVVQHDVEQSFGGVFPPIDGGFSLLTDPGIDFEFTEEHIPRGGDVSFVSWQYRGQHTRPMRAVDGVDAAGNARKFIDPDPADVAPIGDSGPMLSPTGREVTIVGTTLVLARDDEEAKQPILMRFIDWSRVFTQLGYAWDFATVVPSSES